MSQSDTIRVPSDVQAERAILNMILDDNSLLLDVTGILTPKCFHLRMHRFVFDSMISLESEKIPIVKDIISRRIGGVQEFSKTEVYTYLEELEEEIPPIDGIKYLAVLIQEHYQMRELLNVASKLTSKAGNPETNTSALLKEAEDMIHDIASINQKTNIVHIKDAVVSRVIQLRKCSENAGAPVGISCGFRDIDKLLSGLIPGNVITIAGRPSMGKSALAFNMASNISLNRSISGPVLVFSAEMAKEQTASRMIAVDSHVKASKLKVGDMNISEWDRISASTDRLCAANMFIDDTTTDIDQIVFSAKRFHKRHGMSAFFVDYLQLLSSGSKRSREEEVAYMSRKTKQLAKDLSVPVVQLAQLNRGLESRNDKRPLLSDLRESGAIEQDSDVVMFIYRDEYYNKGSEHTGVAEILVRKHRDGPTGVIKLAYYPDYVAFADYIPDR